jgi:hypothetical protein
MINSDTIWNHLNHLQIEFIQIPFSSFFQIVGLCSSMDSNSITVRIAEEHHHEKIFSECCWSHRRHHPSSIDFFNYSCVISIISLLTWLADLMNNWQGFSVFLMMTSVSQCSTAIPGYLTVIHIGSFDYRYRFALVNC